MRFPELLLERAAHIEKTCPVTNVEDKCLTFSKTGYHLELFQDETKEVDIIVPNYISPPNLPANIYVHYVEDVKRAFVPLHNRINENKRRAADLISASANIHPSAVIGVPGNNIVKLDSGHIVNMKHMGNVVIEDNVEVQAQSVIHRAVFTSTHIRKNAQIYALVNIGHNCDIGESTIICPGSTIAGGTKVGKNCYLWQGVNTRSNISICDNVIIGAGSLVLKDIDEPGVYFGSPAKYVKPYEETIR